MTREEVMTRNQRELMRFARLHDWGHDARVEVDGGVTVGCDVHSLLTGLWTREFTTVYSMQELRDLAGY